MGDDYDPRPALAAAAGGAEGAWDFIRWFAERWAAPLTPDDGWPAGELREHAGRLDIRLPAAVHAAYALFGRRDDLVRAQDRLLRPAQWETDESGSVLIVRVENQYTVEWGVPVSREAEASGGPADADPPVWFRATDEQEWRPFLDRFSLACVEMVLSDRLLAPDGPTDNRHLDAPTTTALAERFTPLPLVPYPVWAVPDGPPVRWFTGDGVLLRADGTDWLWARARDAAALDAVRSALPGEWLLGGDH
ncbi:hypothetical protein ACFV0R_05760 [Streptomyces sp. NPDC059578]|uniref:hypothetical protein n=1 Tax=Streptomyces sp. NPDC059578 TaxID=3346874 RepID=UPI00369F5A11